MLCYVMLCYVMLCYNVVDNEQFKTDDVLFVIH